MGLKITINVLALSLAIFVWNNFIPKEKNTTLDIYNILKEKFTFIDNLTESTKESLLKEIAIITGLYFGINFIIGKVK